MKKIFLISLSIIAWHSSIKSMDKAMVTIGERRISVPIDAIDKFSSKLSNLIKDNVNNFTPITIPDDQGKSLQCHLGPLIGIMITADKILEPNPTSMKGSYKELQENRLVRNMNPHKALELILLGERLEVDKRITNALCLRISRTEQITQILNDLKMEGENRVRTDIICQYFLDKNHQMPEGISQAQENPRFTITDVLIHS